MVTIDDWNGQLNGLRASKADVLMEMPLKQSTAGGSGAFKAKAFDGNEYWIKPLNNIQGEMVPVTEQIIGRVGRLIGAPVCEVRTIEITEDFVGWEFRSGRKLQKGIAHASLAVSDCIETKKGQLEYKQNDDNSYRYAFTVALYDWVWGGDFHGLVDLSDDHRFFSHDHGWCLPPEGKNWTREMLISEKDTPHLFNNVGDGIDIEGVKDVCQALERISREQIVEVLKNIPSSWPVSDLDLEAVGFFLESRAPDVAQRLKNNFGIIL